MKHQYRILTVGPDVYNLSAAMPLKMAESLLDYQSCLRSDAFKRYIIVEEVPEK